jgi:citrate lyase beta subunit
MHAVRSLLLVPPGDPQPAVAADTTLLDLMHTDAGGYDTARSAAAALLAAGRRVYLHTRSPQSPDLRDQLLATLRPGVYGVSLPGVRQTDQLRYVDSLLEDVEARVEIEPGTTAIGLWIDNAAALAHAGELATASHRLTWIGVSSAKLAMELALDAPAPAFLDHIHLRVVFAAQAAGLPAVEGLQPGVATDDELALAGQLPSLGLRGALTRHAGAVDALMHLFPASDPPAPAAGS